jgi:hypothetical protein
MQGVPVIILIPQPCIAIISTDLSEMYELLNLHHRHPKWFFFQTFHFYCQVLEMATRQNLSIFPSGFTFSSGDPVFAEFVTFEQHSEPGTVFVQQSQPELRKTSDESSGSGDEPHSSSSNQTKPNSVLRRVHTKSRRGCLNCKRRRIKVCNIKYSKRRR